MIWKNCDGAAAGRAGIPKHCRKGGASIVSHGWSACCWRAEIGGGTLQGPGRLSLSKMNKLVSLLALAVLAFVLLFVSGSACFPSLLDSWCWLMVANVVVGALDAWLLLLVARAIVGGGGGSVNGGSGGSDGGSGDGNGGGSGGGIGGGSGGGGGGNVDRNSLALAAISGVGMA